MDRRPCDVCVLVDKDHTPKEVAWCPRCKAWLCGPCKKNWGRRAIAAFLRGVKG